MEARRKIRILLICTALFILIASVALSAYLFFSNYQNIQLLRQAENSFKSGDDESLKLAQSQLLSLVANDPDNEYAFVLLSKIAKQNKNYPEYVYYSLQAHKLNPLSEENENAYIESLLYSRLFVRLENFLSQKSVLNGELNNLLLYAAGQNGNIGKYGNLLNRRDDNLIAELALLLYKHNHIGNIDKLFILKNYLENRAKNDFHKQEILAAMVRIYLASNDFDNAEKYLLEAYKINEFAFAPALGRFYANYKSLGQAQEILEDYLSIYHDPLIALQLAEIYCLMKKHDKIKSLLKSYQGDSGKDAMVLCYYFELLEKFAANDIASCREYFVALQKVINTPLATFIYLCVELENGNLGGIYKYYNAMLNHRNYLDLQLRADKLVTNFIKKSFESKAKEPMLADLAKKVYWRFPDVTIGKYLLLTQRQSATFDVLLLKDMMNRFPSDQGLSKIALEYYLVQDLRVAEKIILDYMRKFPENHADMLQYRIILGAKQKKFDEVSKLFQEYYSPQIAGEYWNYAISGNRIEDLRFLARNPQYQPYCQSAILLAEGKKVEALNILANADAAGNEDLLFYAAKTLAENDRHNEALKLYKLFPEKSSYRLDVLLNSAELYSALGNYDEAVKLAQMAYQIAPTLSVVQYCLADKLYKNGQVSEIADIAKFDKSLPFSDKMREFLIVSLEFNLKNCNLKSDKDKIINKIERLLRLDPENKIALEYRNKIKNLRRQE